MFLISSRSDKHSDGTFIVAYFNWQFNAASKL